MEIYGYMEFKILGDIIGESLIDEHIFTMTSIQNTKFELKLQLKEKKILTRCHKEVSDDLYNFFKTGFYKSIKLSNDEGDIREDIDKNIIQNFQDDFNNFKSDFFEVTNRLLHYIKTWLSHEEITGIENNSIICSYDGEIWLKFSIIPIINAFDKVIFSNFDEKNCNMIQMCIDNNIEPFIALDFLAKAKSEPDSRHSWVYTTIAAELAIKEFLIAKHPQLETLLIELPSPPLDKLYRKILREYEGIDAYIKIKDIQTAVKIRNYIIHRPQAYIPISAQNSFIYIRLVEATIYQLLQRLHPQLEPIIKDHYPPQMGYNELEKIPDF